jgi:hypothetical protein
LAPWRRARDADATFVVRRGGLSTPARFAPYARWIALVLVASGGLLFAAIRFTAPAPHPAPPAAQTASGPAAMPLAGEAGLLAAPADRLSIWRFRGAPAVMVIIFPSLHAQARTLNRVAAFVEKGGMPHDRVVDDAALNAAIAAGHDSFDTYYYAHDYRAADLARFFATATADGIALRPAEQALHDLLDQAGLLRPGARAALITLPPPGAGVLDASGRAAMLRHELSHGFYFTDPAYAALIRDFWASRMTEAERAAFRRFLSAQGYDPENDDLMRNEMQAYLLFTPDPRLFAPEALGLGQATPAALRAKLRSLLSPGWLKAASAR